MTSLLDTFLSFVENGRTRVIFTSLSRIAELLVTALVDTLFRRSHDCVRNLLEEQRYASDEMSFSNELIFKQSNMSLRQRNERNNESLMRR